MAIKTIEYNSGEKMMAIVHSHNTYAYRLFDSIDNGPVIFQLESMDL